MTYCFCTNLPALTMFLVDRKEVVHFASKILTQVYMPCGHLKYKNSAKLGNNFNIFCRLEGKSIFYNSFNDHPYCLVCTVRTLKLFCARNQKTNIETYDTCMGMGRRTYVVQFTLHVRDDTFFYISQRNY